MGLDQHHIEAAARGIEGDPAASDAATDHEQVGHMAGGEQVQVSGPPPGIEICGGDGHGPSLPGRR